MCYRYIALTNQLADSFDSSGCQLADVLRESGMESRGHMGRLVLFAPRQTPILPLRGGGILLGDLYDKNGKPVTNPAALQHHPTPSALRQHLLDRYWGEYLLFQPADNGTESITLMRDPSGGIACAYSVQSGNGFITSDLSVASRIGLYRDRVDWDFVSHCLIYPYMKVSRTGLAGISELLPGCLLSIDGKNTSTVLAWSPWSFVAPEERHDDPAVAARKIQEITTCVVRAMAETDRTLLLELSGGLDSSIVAACLAQTRSRVTCCTAVTPLPGADERRYAAQITEQLGVELMQRPLEFADAAIAFPLPQHSLRPAVWSLSCAVTRVMDDAADTQNVRSHFSGSGGDTIFCYLTSAAPAADAFRERGFTAGWQAIINLTRLHGCTIAKAAQLTMRKLYWPPKPVIRAEYSLLTQIGEAPPLELHPWFSAPPNALPGDRERIVDLAGNQLFRDGTLRAGGRRIRMPLLSQPVMEACLRVPTWMWISGGQNRAVARAAFSGQLPPDVLSRRSKGTFMNYASAAYNRNTKTIRQFLLDGHLRSRGLLDLHNLELLLDSQQPASGRSFMRVLTLCMIENWVRNHV
ncbi:asparagine synthase C-terminal domain-containing protein [Dyella sp.]|uniref:asparagine synthase C-terminal domain-containing protein n=1 Tax=Dyella sp. TaxID=1869338 RepID=UPI002D78681F|nr:asparagine synthase C-terminal domain-containing protein [Dyella sp.]HET7331361.1 asparagine synthase C-terminal domain-containing protein [Dyella sp.]